MVRMVKLGRNSTREPLSANQRSPNSPADKPTHARYDVATYQYQRLWCCTETCPNGRKAESYEFTRNCEVAQSDSQERLSEQVIGIHRIGGCGVSPVPVCKIDAWMRCQEPGKLEASSWGWFDVAEEEFGEASTMMSGWRQA